MIIMMGVVALGFVVYATYLVTPLASYMIQSDVMLAARVQTHNTNGKDIAQRLVDVLGFTDLRSRINASREIAILWPAHATPLILIAHDQGSSITPHTGAPPYIHESIAPSIEVYSADAAALTWYNTHQSQFHFTFPHFQRRSEILSGDIYPGSITEKILTGPTRSLFTKLPNMHWRGVYTQGRWMVTIDPLLREVVHAGETAQKITTTHLQTLLDFSRYNKSIVFANPFTLQLSDRMSIPAFLLEIAPLNKQSTSARVLQEKFFSPRISVPLHITFALPQSFVSEDDALEAMRGMQHVLAVALPEKQEQILPDGSSAILTLAKDDNFPLRVSTTTEQLQYVLQDAQTGNILLSYDAADGFGIFSTDDSQNMQDDVDKHPTKISDTCPIPSTNFPVIHGTIGTAVDIFPQLAALFSSKNSIFTLILDKYKLNLCIS